jgi:carbamoyl-phosphate synthase large subunit
VRDGDKSEITDAVRKFVDQGFTVYATKGTAHAIRDAGMAVTEVKKLHESSDNIITLMESGDVDYIVSTSSKGRIPSRDSVKIRRKAIERAIPCITSVDTANALADSLRSRFSQHSTELVDINHMRAEKMRLNFTKMNGTSNDYIYFNCFDQQIDAPESLSVYLSDPHGGVGGDGVILICPSDIADAKMRIFNRDGSEGKMCGNGIRCVGSMCAAGKSSPLPWIWAGRSFRPKKSLCDWKAAASSAKRWRLRENRSKLPASPWAIRTASFLKITSICWKLKRSAQRLKTHRSFPTR